MPTDTDEAGRCAGDHSISMATSREQKSQMPARFVPMIKRANQSGSVKSIESSESMPIFNNDSDR
jgi:hypothetical protein